MPQGEVVAEVIAGHDVVFAPRCIPAVVFTDPEIGAVGLSESEAWAQGRKTATGKYPFAGLGRALTTGETDGFVRVVIDAKTTEILGAQIVGPEASDLIAEAGLAIEMGALALDVGLTIHAHPTLAEAFMEAAKAAKSPFVAERFSADDAEGVGSTPAEYAAYIKKEQERWGKVVRAAGVRAD